MIINNYLTIESAVLYIPVQAGIFLYSIYDEKKGTFLKP